MTVDAEATVLEHGLGGLAHDRDREHGLDVRRRREQPEESALTHDATVGVERLDSDIVEVGGAVHCRAAVGLGQHEDVRITSASADLRREMSKACARRTVVANDPEPGALHGLEGRAVLGEEVLAVAQEREVLVDQPAEQIDGLGDLAAGNGCGRSHGKRIGDRRCLVEHARPVLDGLAYVAEHALDRRLDGTEVSCVGLAVDLDVHPRLDDRVCRRLLDVLGVDCDHLEELAHDIPANDHLRVNDEVQCTTLDAEGRRDRVHEEWHVIGDDLDDGVARGPAVALDAGRERTDDGGALRTLLGGPAMREHRPEHVDRVATDEVFRRRVAVVAAYERGQAGVVAPCRLHRSLEQVGLRLLESAGRRRGRSPVDTHRVVVASNGRTAGVGDIHAVGHDASPLRTQLVRTPLCEPAHPRPRSCPHGAGRRSYTAS